jgi:hypothetical protein
LQPMEFIARQIGVAISNCIGFRLVYADQKMRLFWGNLGSGRMYDYKDSVEGSMVIKDQRGIAYHVSTKKIIT